MVNFLAWQTQVFSIFVIAFLLPFNISTICKIRADSKSNHSVSKGKFLSEIDSILLLVLLAGLIHSFITNLAFFYLALVTFLATSLYLLLPRNRLNVTILARLQSKFLTSSLLVLILIQSLLFWAFGHQKDAYATEPGNHDLQYYFDGIYQSNKYSGIQILNNEFLQKYSTSNGFYWGESVNRAGIFDLGSFQFSFSNDFTPNTIYSISLWGTVFTLYALRNINFSNINLSVLQRFIVVVSPMFMLSTFNSDLAAAISGGIFIYFVTLLFTDDLENLKWKLVLSFLITGVFYPELILYEVVYLCIFKFKELKKIISRKISFFSIVTMSIFSLLLALLGTTTFLEVWNAQKTPNYNSFYAERPYFWILSILSTHNLNLSTNYVYVQLFFSALLLVIYLLFFRNHSLMRAFVTITFISIISLALILSTKTFYIEHKMLELLGPSAWFLLVFHLSFQKQKANSRSKSSARGWLALGIPNISKAIVFILYVATIAGLVNQLDYSNKYNRLDRGYFETLSEISDGYKHLRIDDSKLIMPEDFQQLNLALTSLAHRNIRFCFLSQTGSELQGAYFNNLLQVCQEKQSNGSLLVFHPKASPDSSYSSPTLVPFQAILVD